MAGRNIVTLTHVAITTGDWVRLVTLYFRWDSGRGVDAVAISYGSAITSPMVDGTIATITSPATLGISNFSADVVFGTTSIPYAGTTYTETFTARYILFDITSAQNDGDNWVGLSEVQFYGVPSATPGTLIYVQ